MFIHTFVLIFLTSSTLGLPTTTPNSLGETTPNNVIPTQEVNLNAEKIQTTSTTNVTQTELLRQGSPNVTYRRRGRVILATTHVEGTDEWGVSADEAEVSCHRIAQVQSVSPKKIGEIFQSLAKLVKTNPLEGHLISVGSSYEVLALSRLLHPLPDGPFWTGGKVVRYRRRSMHDQSYTDHVLLSWSDGRSGDPRVLGMTEDDELQLKESYVYCLALNLLDSTWQARDCSDKLPYACLVTPKRLRFSNEVNSKNTTSTTSKNGTKSETNDEKAEQSTTAKLMQNTIEVTTTEVPVVKDTTPAVDDVTQTELDQVQETTTINEDLPVPSSNTLSEPTLETTPAILEQTTESTTPIVMSAIIESSVNSQDVESTTTPVMTTEPPLETTSITATSTETSGEIGENEENEQEQ